MRHGSEASTLPLPRLLIAEDHAMVREGMRSMLEGEPDLEVVGEAEDGREALELCRSLCPELVLMDVRMPKMDGIAATRAIKRERPRTIVLMLTAAEDPKHLAEALRAGAAGYILKASGRQEVIDAIRGVLNGESPMNQKLATQLLMRLYNEEAQEEDVLAVRTLPEGRTQEERPEHSLLKTLTPKELEVLRLVAKGQTNRQIADDLFISVTTVKKHVQHIIAKLEVSDRTQAAILAMKLGLLVE
jgi:DNA-binding NarL/FixJ family response regulator